MDRPGGAPRPNELRDGAAPNRLPPAADAGGAGSTATGNDAGFALLAPMIGCLGVLAGYLVAGLVAAHQAGLGPGSLVGAMGDWIGCAAKLLGQNGVADCSLDPGLLEFGGAVFVAVAIGLLAWVVLDDGVASLARLLGRPAPRRDDPRGLYAVVAVVVAFTVPAVAAFYFTTGPDVLGVILPLIALAIMVVPLAALFLLERRDAPAADASGRTGGVAFIAMGDGVTSTFHTPRPYAPRSLMVTVDGLHQAPTESDPAAGEFRLPFVPSPREEVWASWRPQA